MVIFCITTVICASCRRFFDNHLLKSLYGSSRGRVSPFASLPALSLAFTNIFGEKMTYTLLDSALPSQVMVYSSTKDFSSGSASVGEKKRYFLLALTATLPDSSRI